MFTRPSHPLLSRRLSAIVAALVVTASTVALGVHAEGDTDLGGLSVGEQMPRFNITVVNEGFTAAKKWGPNKWVGETNEKKLVVMSFFSIYCEPCKKEIPELVRMNEKYADQGLGVMLVAIDKEPEELPQVQQIARDNKVTFPVVHDKYNMVARRYRLKRIPYMLMLGTDGTVKAVHVGYTEELKANLENEIRSHLGLAPLPATAPPAVASPVAADKTTVNASTTVNTSTADNTASLGDKKGKKRPPVKPAKK
jgi:thiol-disulfide isomerase/thioredoxin